MPDIYPVDGIVRAYRAIEEGIDNIDNIDNGHRSKEEAGKLVQNTCLKCELWRLTGCKVYGREEWIRLMIKADWTCGEFRLRSDHSVD